LFCIPIPTLESLEIRQPAGDGRKLDLALPLLTGGPYPQESLLSQAWVANNSGKVVVPVRAGNERDSYHAPISWGDPSQADRRFPRAQEKRVRPIAALDLTRSTPLHIAHVLNVDLAAAGRFRDRSRALDPPLRDDRERRAGCVVDASRTSCEGGEERDDHPEEPSTNGPPRIPIPDASTSEATTHLHHVERYSGGGSPTGADRGYRAVPRVLVRPDGF
jgi:hypothetical protein